MSQNRYKIRPEDSVATRFRPGVSGNPGGRPRKKPITDSYDSLITTKIPKDHPIVAQVPWLKGKSWSDAIAYGQVLEGAKGGTPAAKEIADRVEGRVREEVEVIGGREADETLLEKAKALLATARGRAKK